MSSFRVVPAVVALLLFGCAEVPSQQPVRPATASKPAVDRHVLAVVSLSADGHKLVTRRVVEGPMQIDRAPASGSWRVEVTGEDGGLLHTAPVRPVGKIRGEFPDADGKLVRHEVDDPNPLVTLRLPILPNAARIRVLDATELWDAQGKTIPRDPATVVELPWSEVMP